MGEAEGSAGDRYSPLKGGHAMFTNRVFRWAVLAVLVLGCALVVRVLAEEAEDKPVKAEPLVLRMYNVKDLLVVPQDHPYKGSGLPAIDSDLTGPTSDSGGCLFPGVPKVEVSGLQEWMAVIQRMVNSQADPVVAAWSDEGGPASIEAISPVLIIKQTAAAHKKIEDLLAEYRKQAYRGPAVTIQAKWVQLDADKAGKLLAAKAGEDGMVVSEAALSEAGAKTVYQGHLRCMDCQVVYLVAGEYRVYLADAEPVVAEGTVGCDPQMSSVLAGAALQVRAVLSPDGGSATLDLYSFVTDLKEMRSKPLPDFGQTQDSAQTLKLDVEMPSVFVHTFATTAKVPLGKPVLIGGMTQPGAEKGKVLCLVLEVTAAK